MLISPKLYDYLTIYVISTIIRYVRNEFVMYVTNAFGQF